MQTCYNCGKQVPDETLICPDCGALVRRYTTPANPVVRTTPAQPVQPVPVQPMARPSDQGRLRLRGPVKVWLIILCVFSGYMAFSSLCCILLGANPQVFDAMLSEPGMESFEPMLLMMRDLLPQALPLFVILFVLFTVKFLLHLWLLLSSRRTAFYVSIGVSILGCLLGFAFGGSISVILYFLDPLVTWLGLRQIWPQLRK